MMVPLPYDSTITMSPTSYCACGRTGDECWSAWGSSEKKDPDKRPPALRGAPPPARTPLPPAKAAADAAPAAFVLAFALLVSAAVIASNSESDAAADVSSTNPGGGPILLLFFFVVAGRFPFPLRDFGSFAADFGCAAAAAAAAAPPTAVATAATAKLVRRRRSVCVPCEPAFPPSSRVTLEGTTKTPCLSGHWKYLGEGECGWLAVGCR